MPLKKREKLQRALSHIKIADPNVEIYPEEHDPRKRFKRVFASNSTFVTFTHLIRAMLGPTILAIPKGFRLGGLAFSPPGLFFFLTITTYNMRRLILNAAFLSEREGRPVRTYDEVAFIAFNTCTETTKKFAKPLRITINILFFVTYLDACVIFMIFISRNAEAIVLHYLPYSFFKVRYFIFFQVFIFMAMSSLRELKQLSPFSSIASILLVTVVVILVSCFFLVNPIDFEDRDLIGDEITLTHFICVVLFCLSGISIALTLKSSMKNPEHFMGFPGIFYISVAAIGVLFTTFGFLGYLKYGPDTAPSVLLNVPFIGPLSIIVKAFAMFSVLFSAPLVFYVSFNVLWSNFLKQCFSQTNVLFSEYCIRYSLIIAGFLIALSFPDLGKMIVLKGALFHTHLELTIPPILDYVTNYPEKGPGKHNFRLVVMLFLSFLGLGLCISGIIVAIIDWKSARE